MKKRSALLLLTFLAGLLLAGCGSVKIGRLRAEPYRYQNRTVRVDGTVTNSFSALVAGFYEVQDDTGKIYVISNGSAPPKGTRVNVKGTLMNGLTVGSRSFGTAIRERGRRSRF